MSIEEQMQIELGIVEKELLKGEITLKQYNSRVAEIREDAQELYRDGRG